MISIIVPIYNLEKYIGRCMDSILNQTYSDLELIIVNDGSTDESLHICQECAEKDNRVVIINQDNRGVSAARNAGLKIARGDFICFVDADDYVDANYLSIMYNNIVASEADISMIKWTRNTIDNAATSKKICIWNKEQTFYNLFKYNRIDGAVYCKLYRKNVIKEISFFDNIKIGEDQFFVIQAVEQSTKIVFQDISAYAYVYRESSAMNTKVDERYWDAVYRAEWIIKKADNYPEMKGLFKQAEIKIYLSLVIMNYKNPTEEGQKIINYVMPRIKALRSMDYGCYSTLDSFMKFFLIKHFSFVAKQLVMLKEKYFASGDV